MAIQPEGWRTTSLLLVDNDTGLLDEVRSFFETSGEFFVQTTGNPENVPGLLGGWKYDAVVSAYRMQPVDGIALLTSLRKAGNSIPFIIFSETGRGKVAIDALNGGADFYLQKGHESEAEFTQLRMLVLQAVAKKRAEDQLRKTNRALRIISECNQALVHATDEQVFLDRVCDILVTKGGYHNIWIGYTKNTAGTTVKPITGRRDGGAAGSVPLTRDEVRDLEKPGRVAIRTGEIFTQLMVYPDPSAVGSNAPAEPAGSSIAAFPLTYDKEVIGALGLVSREPDAFGIHELKLLRDLVNDISYGIKFLRIRKDQKISELALLESERKYRQLVELAQEGIWAIDAGGRTSFVNPRMAAILGYTVDEMQGLSFFTSMDDPARTQAESEIERLKQGKAGRRELGFIRKDGKRIFTRLETSPIIDDGGEYRGALALVADITDYRVAEERLRESETRLREAQQLARIGSWNWTIATNKLSWSEELFRIVGGDPSLPPPTIDEHGRFFTPDSWNHLRVATGRARTTGEPYELQLELIRSDGIHRHVIGRGEAIPDDNGKIERVHGTIHDITEWKDAELSLQQSEDQFRTMFENAAIGMSIISTDGHFIDLNSSLENMLGYTVDELSQASFVNLIHPDHHEKSSGWVKDLFEDFLPQTQVTTEFSHRDHRVVRAEVTASLIRFPDGSPRYFVMEIQDVTERALAVEALIRAHDEMEQRVQERTAQLKETNLNLIDEISRSQQLMANLKESETIYRSIGELIPFGIWLCDARGEATYFSDSFLDAVGKTANACAGTGWTQCLPSEDTEKTMSDWRRCVEAGKSWDYEYRIRDPAGLYRTVLSRGAPIRDGEGRITSWAGINLDITDRQNAEEERSRLAAIVTSSDDAIIGKTLDGTIFSWNAGAEKVYGYTPPEAIGRNVSMLTPPGRDDDTGDILERIRRDVPVVRYETARITKDGRILDISITASPIRDSRGNIVGASSIGRDITASRQVQADLSASLREKEILLKEIHHRVKNNIQVISSLLSMQSRTISDPSMKDVLRDAQDRVKSIALVHEKLYQSKSIDLIDYHDYLKKISRYLSSSYGINPATIGVHVGAENVSLDIDKAVPCSLIINELLSNAFKHAFPGGRKGEVDLTIMVDADHFIIRYMDDGIGLPAGFSPCSECNSSTLGMQILSGLTRQLKGTIAFENGSGTRCTIRFPA